MENGLCPDRNELVDFATRYIEGYRPIAHFTEGYRMKINNHLLNCYPCRIAVKRYQEQFLAIKLKDGIRLQYEIITIDRVPERYMMPN